MHPTAFHAARPRWGAAGAKSDPGDSYKLADYLRTDGHRLRRLQPLDPGLRELQALVRLREDHVRAGTAASNQLGALLDAYWPGPKAMFCKLASDIALAFLADYPTPQSAVRLGQARLAAFCRRHADRGGKPPADLLARLRAAPIPPVGLSPAVLAQLVTTQVQLLRSLQATIGELEAAIKQRVAQHPRAKLLRALPGVGTINLAQLLAEVGPILIAGRRQLVRVLHIYVEHYNRHRPHRGLGLSAPEPSECCEQADPSAAARQPYRRDVLGGLIHEYERAA